MSKHPKISLTENGNLESFPGKNQVIGLTICRSPLINPVKIFVKNARKYKNFSH
jgi:hypothetical protein